MPSGRGKDMPRYRNPEYAHFKTSINPNNRGFWDLRVTGQYQSFVDVIVHPAVIFFKNDLQKVATWQTWNEPFGGNRGARLSVSAGQ